MSYYENCKILILFDFADDTISRFSHEIKNWVEREETAEFRQLIHRLALPTHLQQTDWRSFVGEMSSITCTICQSVLNTFMEYRKNGMSAEDIRCNVIQLCEKLKVQTKQVCRGAITINLVSKLNCYANKILKIFILSL